MCLEFKIWYWQTNTQQLKFTAVFFTGILINLFLLKFTVIALETWCRSELLTSENAVIKAYHTQKVSRKLQAELEKHRYTHFTLLKKKKKKKCHPTRYQPQRKALFSITLSAPTWLKADWQKGVDPCFSFGSLFPGGLDDKNSTCNAGDLGSIPGLGQPPGEGNGNQLQYSCLENSMDRGAW